MFEFIAFLFGLFMWIKPEYMTKFELRTNKEKVKNTRNLGILITVVMGLLVLAELIQNGSL
jgi:nicotinamide riboside transporter PnuC